MVTVEHDPHTHHSFLLWERCHSSVVHCGLELREREREREKEGDKCLHKERILFSSMSFFMYLY